MNLPPLRFPRGLYGISPDWPDTQRLLAAIEQAHAGGMSALQLRRKSTSAAERRAQAIEVHDLCARLGLALIINDDWRLAAELGAGLHLGRTDGSLAQARQALGAQATIGVSCYNESARAARLLGAGADYVAFGALYPSATKPEAVRAPAALLRTARDLASGWQPRPAVVAIGGLTPTNSGAVLRAGADSLAVLGALFLAPDIQAAARAFSKLLPLTFA